MSSLILFFIFIANVISYDINLPSCNNCKWFIQNKNIFDQDYGLCKMVQHKVLKNKKVIVIYEYAQHCRNNENLCGKAGFLYEDKKNINSNKIDLLNINNIMNELEELRNRCCGEVNELSEIEELEKDVYNLLKIIKKIK
jgi:hypothetical protein